MWSGRRERIGSAIEHTTNFEINAARQVIRTEAVRSGCAPFVPMMQPTDLRNGDDPSSVWRLDRSGFRTVFVQRQMCAAPMIIFEEPFEVLVQAAFVNYDHVIQALAANRADDSFHV